MNIANWVVAVFSPTGGTGKVAGAIAAGFGTPLVEVDLTKEDSTAALGERDGLMAVLPVYGGRVPQVALDRLSAIRGSGQKAVAVVVYGNREFDDALLETRNVLTENGFQVIAAAAFIAEHSVVRSIAAGRPDGEDLALCRRFGADVMARSDDCEVVSVPGNDPYLPRKPAAFHPAAGDGCVRCGVCAGQCPVGAIPPEDPCLTNGDACINCMRCVQVCPTGYRSLPADYLAGAEKMLSEKAGGYKKPVIFL